MGRLKIQQQGNDAKFHLFVFQSKVVLPGAGNFKNRAFLMEKWAKGKVKNSEPN